MSPSLAAATASWIVQGDVCLQLPAPLGVANKFVGDAYAVCGFPCRIRSKLNTSKVPKITLKIKWLILEKFMVASFWVNRTMVSCYAAGNFVGVIDPHIMGC